MTSAGTPCRGTGPAPLNRSQIQQAVFEEMQADPGVSTVGSTYNYCSYGKTRLTTDNSLVADTVRLGCSGRRHAGGLRGGRDDGRGEGMCRPEQLDLGWIPGKELAASLPSNTHTHLPAQACLPTHTFLCHSSLCSYGVPWSMATCEFDDFNGWADAADAALKARGVDVDQYFYR